MLRGKFVVASAAALSFAGSFANCALAQAIGNPAAEYPTRFTVAPNVSSLVVIKVLPKGTCVLHAEGSTDPQQSLRLFADDDGFVRFYVKPQQESDQLSQFQIDCEAEGTSRQFPLQLRSSSSPTPDMPSPSSQPLLPAAGAQIRPALSLDDANNLPTEELLRRGYPPRPDSNQAPQTFATWSKAVTKPARLVPPRLVPNPGVTHTKAQVRAAPEAPSSNWSGYVLQGLPQSFNNVWGDWQVPAVVDLFEPGTWTFSALWIGLDGQNKNEDLVQEGTEQDALEICFLGCFNITVYYAWTEVLPQQQNEQVIGSMHVQPGDEMFAMAGMSNGTEASLVIENISQSEYTLVKFQTQPGQVIGHTAEWIMERPLINGSVLPDLADYGFAVMTSAVACDANGSCSPYSFPYGNGITSQQLWMYNGNDLLSWASAVSEYDIAFYWIRNN